MGDEYDLGAAMLKTVLLPLDGSVASELAMPFAEGITRAASAKLILLRAVHLARSMPGAGTFNDQARAGAERELAEVRARLPDSGDVEVLIWDDEAGRSIIEVAKKRQADVIVMSTHGRTGLSRAFYGSVADQVLRAAPVPVLLVPPTAQYRMNPSCKIIVPLDGSVLAEAAVAPAIDLAEALRGEILLVRATEPPTYWIINEQSATKEPDPGSEVEGARFYLEGIGRRFRNRDVEVSGYATDGAPHEVILNAARDHRAGAIAMATHGRSGLARTVMGSVAQQVLQSASVPLLLVHPERPRRQREDRSGETLAGARPPRPESS